MAGWQEFWDQPWVRARALRALPVGSGLGRRGHPGIFEQWTPPGDDDSRTRRRTMFRRAPPSGPSIWRSRSAATATSPPSSIRSARRRSAIRRCAERHGITEDDLKQLPATLVSAPLAAQSSNMRRGRGRAPPRLLLDDRLRLRARLRARRARTGCGTPPRRAASARPPIRSIRVALLDRLTQVEAFERFLHRTFPGKTRFSIEGLDMLVPILDEIIARRGRGGRQARAHRHGAPRPAERAGARPAASRTRRSSPSSRTRSSTQPFREDLAWTGDVKYHAGAHRAIKGGARCELVVVDAAEPEPSRGGRSGGRRHGARRGHRRRRSPARRAFEPARSAADPDSRRRRVPRPGHRRRDAEPVAAAPATTPAARFTSSPTTSSGSRPTPRRVLQHAATRAAWRAASRFRSSTSTPTIRTRASRRRGWRARTARRSSATS